MTFYVAVGPRGLLFRVGMILTGVMGPLTYWWSSRRRPSALPPWSWPEALSAVQDSSDLPADPPIDSWPTGSLPVLENVDEPREALR